MATTTDTPQALKAHIALNVKDVAKSIDFYRAMFGIEPSKVRNGYAKFDVADPPLNLTLNRSANAGQGTLSHLGIQMRSSADVFTLRDRWRAAGLDPRDEVGEICCYALQDKSWVRDPDGNEWEAFVVLEDNLSEERNAASGCCTGTDGGSSCC